ncbi:hypothetical protein ABK040_003779 [Willaertia magna]
MNWKFCDSSYSILSTNNTTNYSNITWNEENDVNKFKINKDDLFLLSSQLPTLNETERIMASSCIEMFCFSCARTLRYMLDPEQRKLYQKNIKVGNLKDEYFLRYFVTSNGIQINKTKYITFRKKKRRVKCWAIKFDHFNKLPHLACNKDYALKMWTVNQPLFINGSFIYIEKTYRMYFSSITFILNDLTKMVTVDFEINYEIFDLQSNNFVKL